MRIISIDLELLDDLVQSARAASAGHHESLAYIQGASLLGALAGRLYNQLGDLAFDAFHSGAVRFGDARPLSPSGLETRPVPLAWLHDKGASVVDDKDFLQADKISICTAFSSPGEAEGKVQMREGFVSPAGEWVRPGKSYRLRTAIDAAGFGKPMEQALFGYEALRAGSGWRAQIAIDGKIAAKLEEPLVNYLGDAILRLGASRGAEYGRVKVKKVARLDAAAAALPNPNAKQVTVYLESDTAPLLGDTNLPCLSPRPELFGLPSCWKVVPHKSAVMIRRYSPFNNHRRRRDLERQVFRQGSVLVFTGQDAPDPVELKRIASEGTGAYRQDGLGKVIFEPDFLRGRHPEFTAPKKETGSPKTAALQPTELGRWMQSEVAGQRQFTEIWSRAKETAKKVRQELDNVKRRKDRYPGRSQWQQVAALAVMGLSRTEGATDEFEKKFEADIVGRGAASHSWKNAEKARKLFLKCAADLDDRAGLQAKALAARLVARGVSADRKEG